MTPAEVAAARDYLIGVFPLRFETAGAVGGALGGLVVHGLSVDELATYRERIEAVDEAAVLEAARSHLHVDDAAIVLVGDADAFAAELEASGLGPKADTELTAEEQLMREIFGEKPRRLVIEREDGDESGSASA